MSDKPKRTMSWDKLGWEAFIRRGVKVTMAYPNGGELYTATVISYANGNFRLQMEDGREVWPEYAEQLRGIETDTEIIEVQKVDK